MHNPQKGSGGTHERHRTLSLWQDCCQRTTGDDMPKIDLSQPITKLRPRLKVTLKQSTECLPDTSRQEICHNHQQFNNKQFQMAGGNGFVDELRRRHKKQQHSVSLVIRNMPPVVHSIERVGGLKPATISLVAQPKSNISLLSGIETTPSPQRH